MVSWHSAHSIPDAHAVQFPAEEKINLSALLSLEHWPEQLSQLLPHLIATNPREAPSPPFMPQGLYQSLAGVQLSLKGKPL